RGAAHRHLLPPHPGAVAAGAAGGRRAGRAQRVGGDRPAAGPGRRGLRPRLQRRHPARQPAAAGDHDPALRGRDRRAVRHPRRRAPGDRRPAPAPDRRGRAAQGVPPAHAAGGAVAPRRAEPPAAHRPRADGHPARGPRRGRRPGARPRSGAVGQARGPQARRGRQPHGPARRGDARMNVLTWSELDDAAREEALRRGTAAAGAEVSVGVADILRRVRTEGDAALRELTARLDGAEVAVLEVPVADRDAAVAGLDPVLREAIAEAAGRIRVFHEAGMQQGYAVETAPGVECRRVVRPVRRVGLYVPAGSAPLPSTALMLGVPAQLAACPEIVLCTPPRPDGTADPAVLAAAAECGITRVFVVGGAQAVAAMAYGTQTVPRCDKIFGPGNAWVTEAKRQVSTAEGGPGIDLPAGPPEVLVVADAGADPESVAADLRSQAQHGPDSQVLLL